ncbi:MAG: DMT family transporter [Gammaproteobacteria bacterium]|nr:DMT family transporter [Gammaproteobacteria bacterium]
MSRDPAARVTASYLGIVLIWSTTPLAIQWSTQGPGFLFGVSARMTLGAVLCLLVATLLRIRLPWDLGARRTYVIAGCSIYAAMSLTYWGAQFVPSGLIAVMFGINPFFVSLFAFWLLGERLLPVQLLGIALGLGGLMLIFGSDLVLGLGGGVGLLALLAAVTVHSLSIVLIKRVGSHLPALAANTGSLALAVVLFAVTWLLGDTGWPQEIPSRAGWSILYLAVIGTLIGFNLFYFVLKHVSAGSISLITLITPVSALLLGSWLNQETISLTIWGGTALVLSGLALHRYAWRWSRVEPAP